MKKKQFWATFIFVCVCGFFVALAGGVEWGTESCGALAGSTLFLVGALGKVRTSS